MPGGLRLREVDPLAPSHTAGQQQSRGPRTRGAWSAVSIPGRGQHGLWVGLQHRGFLEEGFLLTLLL